MAIYCLQLMKEVRAKRGDIINGYTAAGDFVVTALDLDRCFDLQPYTTELFTNPKWADLCEQYHQEAVYLMVLRYLNALRENKYVKQNFFQGVVDWARNESEVPAGMEVNRELTALVQYMILHKRFAIDMFHDYFESDKPNEYIIQVANPRYIKCRDCGTYCQAV